MSFITMKINKQLMDMNTFLMSRWVLKILSINSAIISDLDLDSDLNKDQTDNLLICHWIIFLWLLL